MGKTVPMTEKQQDKTAKDPSGIVFQDEEIIRANEEVHPQCPHHHHHGVDVHHDSNNTNGNHATVGRVLRGIMKFTNLDFLYVFDKHLDPIRLKDSLGKLLNHYPTLAGRMEKDCRIHLNNQGAIFRVQTTSASIREVPEEPEIGMYCNIPGPGEQVQGRAPLLTVTLTLFRDGSFLGVVLNHLVADAWTFAMFMKDWSDMFNTGNLVEPVLYRLPEIVVEKYETQEQADRASEELGNVKSSWFKQRFFTLFMESLVPSFMGRDHRLGCIPDRLKLHYSDRQLKEIKAKAQEQAGTWLSTNEALMGFVWKLCLDAAGMGDSSRYPLVGAGFAINLRNKLPGVSSRLAGNVVAVTTLTIDRKDSAGRTLDRQIHDNLRDSIQVEKLQKVIRILNRNYVAEKGSDTPFVLHESKTHGDLAFGHPRGRLSWNSQSTNPYFAVNFDAKPLRGIPWDWTQPFTVLPGVNGGLDVYIDKTSRGPVAWKQPTESTMKRARVCHFLGFATIVSGSFAYYQYGRSTTASLLLTGTGVCSALLWRKARLYLREEDEAAKREFFEYIRDNAHRSLIEV